MKYIVIRDFSDGDDNMYIYRAGDKFPRSGVNVSDGRIGQLLGTGNRQGRPLIKEAVSEATEGHREEKTGVNPPKKPEAKKKAGRGHRKNA